MLQVASATFHSETPNSSAGHSSLGTTVNHSWNSEHRMPYKRQKTSDSFNNCKKVKLLPMKDVSKDFGINSSEITLTVIQKTQSPTHSSKDKEEEEEEKEEEEEEIVVAAAAVIEEEEGKDLCKDKQDLEKSPTIDKNNNNFMENLEPQSASKEVIITKSKPVVISFSNSDDINYCEIVSEKLSRKNNKMAKNEQLEDNSLSDTYDACMQKINQNAEVSVFRTLNKNHQIQQRFKNEGKHKAIEETSEQSLHFYYVNCSESVSDSPDDPIELSDPCNVPEIEIPEPTNVGVQNFNTTDIYSWPKNGKMSSKMSMATSRLLQNEEKNMFEKSSKHNTLPQFERSTITPTEDWESEEGSVFPQSNNWENSWNIREYSTLMSDQSHLSPDSAYGSIEDSEMSHYLIGFPNPPGENRCWLNATLQAFFATLFTLPIVNDFQILNSGKCTKLTKMLIDIQETWRKGPSEKQKVYHTVKNFKEDLGILDVTYPLDNQQDVSEFLMKFLNYIKSDFEKIQSKDAMIQEIENMPENQQESPRKSKSAVEGSKRQPLVNLYLQNGERTLRRTTSFSDSVSKTQDSTKGNRLSESAEESQKTKEFSENSPENPIDKYFRLNMIEDYVCNKCLKRRRSFAANLMLYVDLPTECEEGFVELADAIDKIFALEERKLTCESCDNNTHNLRIYFKEHPKVMMVQINRYGISKDGTMNKICMPVRIPESLPLSYKSNESSDSKTYEPVCIICHVGGNMDCGHYTSYVKHEDQWFHYNDMCVTPMTSKEALKAAQATAYIIFYVDVEIMGKDSSNCFTS